MEKIRDSIKKDLPPLRLYLDELNEVFEVLSEHHAELVTIETCGYRLTHVDELGKLPSEQTHELYINSLRPYLRMRFTPTYGEIYIGEGDLESEGLVSRLERILAQGKAWLPSLPKSNWVAVLLGIPLWIGIFLQNVLLIIIGLSIVVFSLLWAWLCYISRTQRYSTVIFKLRKEAPNFWKRNRDELIMLAVGTIIGVVVTKLIDVLLK